MNKRLKSKASLFEIIYQLQSQIRTQQAINLLELLH